MSQDPQEIARLLAEPFPLEALGFKPQATSKDGTKALPVAYIDARDVIDRLNAVLGIDGWQDHYRETPHGVICTLRVSIDGRGIEHEDFGGYSDQTDQGDKHKAAFSDALKRAAVKLGVGRYLYRLELPWTEYDAQKKKFVKNPSVPDWALPADPELKRRALAILGAAAPKGRADLELAWKALSPKMQAAVKGSPELSTLASAAEKADPRKEGAA